jgi:hypothetical protein
MEQLIIRLPPDVKANIDNLVASGVYVDAEEAVIALIRVGLSARGSRERPGVYPTPPVPPPAPPGPPGKWPDHYEFKK